MVMMERNLFILLSYEKLQRPNISNRSRPIEASLRKRLLVWNLLKKIESDPAQETQHETQEELENENEQTSWMLDVNSCEMDIEEYDSTKQAEITTAIVTANNDDGILLEQNILESMDTEQQILNENECLNSSLSNRAIGSERRHQMTKIEENTSVTNVIALPVDRICEESEKLSHTSPLLPFPCTNTVSSSSNYLDETEQFFHDLCQELTSTAAVVCDSYDHYDFTLYHEQTCKIPSTSPAASITTTTAELIH
ncbi:unnamed protein product [Didymodactylos carnosus]|uniref:Uncharacterized protein n=1 Tax=Didymodactylos carnosus TaxID=1234261 RepID=A0A813QG29_9BILA|nr:unnamed protein product [Didymodactylos carnosus]CAF0859054.1 unnamed protein product [Didymodactylos carnosus]CAF3547892.1 unnamed protein product [Didymodactylos carnosus]CAF3644041.1 unnamed protein product [Didymodactylos carnosus]